MIRLVKQALFATFGVTLFFYYFTDITGGGEGERTT